MKHLADLPSIGMHQAQRIFLCYSCHNVIAEPRQAASIGGLLWHPVRSRDVLSQLV